MFLKESFISNKPISELQLFKEDYTSIGKDKIY